MATSIDIWPGIRSHTRFGSWFSLFFVFCFLFCYSSFAPFCRACHFTIYTINSNKWINRKFTPKRGKRVENVNTMLNSKQSNLHTFGEYMSRRGEQFRIWFLPEIFMWFALSSHLFFFFFFLYPTFVREFLAVDFSPRCFFLALHFSCIIRNEFFFLLSFAVNCCCLRLVAIFSNSYSADG